MGSFPPPHAHPPQPKQLASSCYLMVSLWSYPPQSKQLNPLMLLPSTVKATGGESFRQGKGAHARGQGTSTGNRCRAWRVGCQCKATRGVRAGHGGGALQGVEWCRCRAWRGGSAGHGRGCSMHSEHGSTPGAGSVGLSIPNIQGTYSRTHKKRKLGVPQNFGAVHNVLFLYSWDGLQMILHVTCFNHEEEGRNCL